MNPKIQLESNANASHRKMVFDLLEGYNSSQAGLEPEVPLAVLLYENNEECVIGGLWGLTYYKWLFIELLIIPERFRYRGIGTAVMDIAHDEALRRGCNGAWIDTFSFQARGFYEKLGYSIFGVIHNYPPGHCRYFMQKLLVREKEI